MSFLYLKNLRVTNANPHAGYYLLGLPAMTGVTGFAHRLQRDLSSKLESSPVIIGTALIVHQMQRGDSHAKFVNYRHDSLKKGVTAATVDRRTVHLQMDLILRIKPDEATKGNTGYFGRKKAGSETGEDLKSFLLSKAFEQFLLRLPFCSGRLERWQHSSTSLRKDRSMASSGIDDQWVFYFDTREQLKDALDGIPSTSFVIEDAEKRFEQELGARPDEEPLELLLNLIQRYPKELRQVSDPRPEEDRRWYLPLAVGYQALDDEPVHRLGSRGGYAHIFAEPVIGLGIARSMGSFRTQSNNEDLPIFWKYHIRSDEGLYLVQGQAMNQ